MGTLSRALGALWLRGETWEGADQAPLYQPILAVAAASLLFAFARFGGILVETPRAFVRMALIGIWGWLGLALLTGLAGLVLGRRENPSLGAAPTFQRAVVVTGLAHIPVLIFAMVMFMASNLFELLGPGRVLAVIVLAFWMPASIVVGFRQLNRFSWAASALSTIPPYLLWLAVVARYLLNQVAHLL